MFFIFIALIIVFITGYSIGIFFLADKAKKIEILPMAFVVGLVVMGYFILFASILTGNFATAVWIFMALGGIYSVYFGFINFKKLKSAISSKELNTSFLIGKLKEISWPEIIFFLLFLLFFFDIFSKTIVYQDGAYKVAFAGYGDIPFHMAEVSYFIHNNPFALEEPIYLGSKLVYAFLINLLSGVFYVLSGNYILSFNLPSYILFFTGFFFIYKFISAFIKTVAMRILAFLIMFLGSGAEFIKIFQDSLLWEKSSIGGIINYILHLPYPIVVFYNAVFPAQNNIWSSFTTMFLTHQRSFFFGFAAGAMILYVLSEALKNGHKKYFYFIGLLIGFLPLIHMHSFIAILLIVFGFYVWKIFIREKSLAKNLFNTILTGTIIGFLISYFFILDFSSGVNFLTFRLGWMSESGGIGSIQYNPAGGSPVGAWISYLWENFGLFFPLLIAAIIYFIYKKNDLWRKKDSVFGLIFSGFFIFIVVNTIKFQPWDYDNGKIFGYFYLLGSVIIVYFFEQWKFKFNKLIAVILTFFMIFVGLIDTFSRSSFAGPPFYEIFGAKEQKAAEWIINNTLSNDIILTGTSHLNPVNSLAGRPVVMGYPGWLWSHGIKYQAREKDIMEIYRGSAGTKDLLKKYSVSYIFIGAAERSMPNFNEQFFTENYPVVFQEGDIKIYKVN
ncbi:MAG: hypothetical protein Q8N37_01085 [bacterium]|nr:hypothetical protein [bacterium]